SRLSVGISGGFPHHIHFLGRGNMGEIANSSNKPCLTVPSPPGENNKVSRDALAGRAGATNIVHLGCWKILQCLFENYFFCSCLLPCSPVAEPAPTTSA